ncbi:hypothetical protein IGJ55_002456 [Enterococcus sp. AZ170]
MTVVKMVIGEVQTQTEQIKSYAKTYSQALESVSTATQGIQLAVGMSGEGMDAIKSYLSSVYPALCKAAILHSEAVVQANEQYVEAYISQCGSEDLDSEELQEQINEADKLIQGFQSSKDSYTQAKQNLSDDKDKLMGMIFQAAITIMDAGITRNQAKKAKIEGKLQKFLAFCDQSTSYFDGLSDTGNLLSKGMQALGVNGNGSIGPGSWNGKGFSLKDTSWMKDVNKRWNDRHQTSEQKFVRNLKEQYGFDDETAQIILKMKENIDKNYPNLSQRERDYILNRLLGGLVYGEGSLKQAAMWANTAGLGITDGGGDALSIEDQLKKLLGLSDRDYDLLRYKVRIQNMISSSGNISFSDLNKDQRQKFKNTMGQALGHDLSMEDFEKLWNNQYNQMRGKGDFAHQSITQATILNPGIPAAAGNGGRENANRLSGWKGDATKAAEAKPSLGPDDYKADLDSENITYLMNKNKWSYMDAMNYYHNRLRSGQSRAQIFTEHTSYNEVKKTIFDSLKVNSMKELKEKYYDSYRFLCNLKDKNNELKDY